MGREQGLSGYMVDTDLKRHRQERQTWEAQPLGRPMQRRDSANRATIPMLFIILCIAGTHQFSLPTPWRYLLPPFYKQRN